MLSGYVLAPLCVHFYDRIAHNTPCIFAGSLSAVFDCRAARLCRIRKLSALKALRFFHSTSPLFLNLACKNKANLCIFSILYTRAK